MKNFEITAWNIGESPDELVWSRWIASESLHDAYVQGMQLFSEAMPDAGDFEHEVHASG